MSRVPPVDDGALQNEAFRTTRWSLVAAAVAKAEPTPQSNAALAELCQAYWYPLYAFVRRRGHDCDDAADLTQSFFARLLEKNSLAVADASRGRFRSFLLGSLTNFLCNESDRGRTLKRGGDKAHVSFEVEEAESRYRMEPVDGLTPEKMFDRRWAILLLEQTLRELRAEYEEAGNLKLFDALKGALTCSPDAAPHQTVAADLEMSEGAVRVALHRLRDRYRQRLRSIICDSVASEQDVEDEIRHLFDAFAPAAR